MLKKKIIEVKDWTIICTNVVLCTLQLFFSFTEVNHREEESSPLAGWGCAIVGVPCFTYRTVILPSEIVRRSLTPVGRVVDAESPSSSSSSHSVRRCSPTERPVINILSAEL